VLWRRHDDEPPHLSLLSWLRLSDRHWTVIGAGIFSGSADFSKLYKIVACGFATPFFAILTSYILTVFWGACLIRLQPTSLSAT